MRLIVPNAGKTTAEVVDAADFVAAESRAPGENGAWVFCNMVVSIDGAATHEGRSGGLGGPGDRDVFAALRSAADVVVAGAETVRSEGYHLPRQPPPALAALRANRGQLARPRLCIVTRQAGLADHVPLLDELPAAGSDAAPWERPILATVGPRPEGSARYDPRFEVIELGEQSVDLGRLITELAARGLRRILCEGGPSLLAQLGADGLIDEWNFTIAPIAVGGTSQRPMHGPAAEARLRLDRALLDDDSALFTRYFTQRPD